MTTIRSNSQSRLPSRFLAAAVVVTAIALMWYFYHSFQGHQRSSTIQDRLLRLEELRGRLTFYDEAFTMSARMAAATGDLQWERRYNLFEPKYVAAITEIQQLAPEASASVAETDDANVKLMLMEHRVFKLAQLRRLDEARKILASQEYRGQVRNYDHGMQQLLAHLQRISQRERQSDRHRNVQQAIMALGGIVIFLVGWLFALRATEHQVALMASRVHLETTVSALAEANETLDRKVAERTRESEAARIAALNMMEDATESRGQADALNHVLRQEISERERAEGALIEIQTQLRAVIQSLDDVVFEFDEQGTYINIWCYDETSLVRPKQELIGRRVADVLGQAAAEPFVAAFQRVLNSRRTEDMEYEFETMDGTRCFLARISPIPDADTSSRTVSMLSRDITERKQAEELIHRQQAELRTLFDLMPAMIWFKDTENNHLRVNQRVADAAGKSVEEIEGKPAAEIYPEEAARHFVDDLEVIHSGKPKLGIVEVLRNQDGDRALDSD